MEVWYGSMACECVIEPKSTSRTPVGNRRMVNRAKDPESWLKYIINMLA